MPFYEDLNKQQAYIGNPELNPNLIKGKTLIGDTINSDVLSAQNLSSEISYPQESSIFPVASLGGSLQLTQPEQKVEDFSSQLQKLNEQLLGQSAFKTGQEQAQGVPELQKTQADLVGRLKTLQAEALQIPLQLQQEATGRGITAGGLRPIEQAALRTNAIQALSVGALLEASRGQLTTALDLVDRAVNQKYDPIKEQIAVKQANLDIILKSPSYSLAEKKRAEQQKAIQADQLKNLKQQEQNETEIMQIAINAVQGGADALTLRNIQRASSPQEALQLAAPFLQPTEKPSKILSVSEAKTLGVPFGTTEEQAFGITPKKTEPSLEISFSDTQIAKGAAVAETPINEFQKFDQDTQNFFINNSDKIRDQKKFIDEAQFKKEDPATLKNEINTSNLPQIAKDMLIKYVDSKFPEQKEENLSWWNRTVNYISSFF